MNPNPLAPAFYCSLKNRDEIRGTPASFPGDTRGSLAKEVNEARFIIFRDQGIESGHARAVPRSRLDPAARLRRPSYGKTALGSPDRQVSPGKASSLTHPL